MIRKISCELIKSVDFKTVTSRFLSATTTLCKEAPKETAKPVEQTIKVEKEKHITMIGINRPQHRNAINSATATQLCDAFSNFENDETSTVAVLYGVGGSFCAGYDVLELGTDGDKVSIDILMSHEGSVGPTRRQLLKPVVCAVNGYCVANGLELALMCDLRVMEESSMLGFFNRRFGVPVIDGGTVRLPAMIGFSRALDLILTGRQVSAEEAFQMGIANRIVPTGTSLIHAMELAHTLAKFPQGALLHDRRSLYSAVFDGTTFSQAVQIEVMYTSKDIIEEMKEGIKWFNKTFSADGAESWLKREKSMADWDDQNVAKAAAEMEEAKQAIEDAKKEADKLKKAEKMKKGTEKNQTEPPQEKDV